MLDSVRVVATVPYDRDATGFAARRRQGFGIFLDRAAMARRGAVTVTDALVGLPGIYGQAGPSGDRASILPGASGRAISMRGTDAVLCTPTIRLDGQRLPEMDVDWAAPPSRVSAVEVYARAPHVPQQFGGLTGCGAIVVWTDDGPRRPRR